MIGNPKYELILGLLDNENIRTSVKKCLSLDRNFTYKLSSVIQSNPKFAGHESEIDESIKKISVITQFNINIKIQALIKLEKQIKNENLKLILMKSMATLLYVNNKKYRNFADIDILVERDHVDSVREILKIDYYLYENTTIKPNSGKYEETWINKKNKNILIDLHWTICDTDVFQLSTKEIVTRAKLDNRFSSNCIFSTSIEDTLINYILQSIKDCSIINYATLDIFLLLREPNFDFNYCKNKTEKLGIHNLYNDIIKLSKKDFDISLKLKILLKLESITIWDKINKSLKKAIYLTLLHDKKIKVVIFQYSYLLSRIKMKLLKK